MQDYDDTCFNPTMVRLLRQFPMWERVLFPLFQSHNGAIAAVDEVVGELTTWRFQSHNGAIAASDFSDQLVHEIWFQSHNGAIAA